jgi:hypothetical protein
LKKNKLKVEAFFPFSSCACAYAPFMERITRVTAKFKDSVELQMKSTSSKEARKYGVQNSCIIVDGVIRLSGAFSEKELEDAIAERTTDGA